MSSICGPPASRRTLAHSPQYVHHVTIPRCHPAQAQREPGPTRKAASQSLRFVIDEGHTHRSANELAPGSTLFTRGDTGPCGEVLPYREAIPVMPLAPGGSLTQAATSLQD